MKLRMKDKVMVIAGRDKGKQGDIIAVLPKTNQVVVEGVSIAKRHLKANAKNPKGGIVELTKPISVSKVMAIDPKTGRAARIGFVVGKDGKKERIFKVSKFQNPKKTAAKPAKAVANKNEQKNDKQSEKKK